MSINLEELGKATIGLVTALKAIVDLVNKIRQRLLITRNNSDLERMDSELSNLVERLEKVSSMASSLRHYIDGYVGATATHESCGKLLEMLAARRTPLNSPESRHYDIIWADIDVLFSSGTDKARQTHIKVMLDRLKFLDTDDAKDVKNQIREFNDTYKQAEVYLSNRDYDHLSSSVRRLFDRAQALVGIFDDSTDKIIAYLARIKE